MKTSLRLLLILLAACALTVLDADGQEARLSAGKIKSKRAVVLVENDQRKDYVDLYTKVLKLRPEGLKVNPVLIRGALPDLTVADVAMTKNAPTIKQKWYVKILNKGVAKSEPCNLRFRFGMYLLDDASLETQDFAVPSIAPGQSALIYFEPPHKDVNWWIFGVNLDPDHPAIKETTQANNAYVIEADTGEKFLTPKQ